MIKIDIGTFHNLSKASKAHIFNECYTDLEEIVADVLPQKRYEHSRSVADVAVRLAYRHHESIKKAWIAGILHDITKYLDEKEHIAYFKSYDIDKLQRPKPMWHSYSAVYFIKEKLNLYDGDILNAIYHHTDGESNSILAKIIYIADKREPLREIDDDIIEMAQVDLHRAFIKLKHDVERYVNEHE